MIVNGLFPIGETPSQQGVKGPATKEDGFQGGDFPAFLFLILAAPAIQIAQSTREAEPFPASETSTAHAFLAPATSEGGGEDSITSSEILPALDQSGESQGQPMGVAFTFQTQLWQGLSPQPTPETLLGDGIKASAATSTNDGAGNHGQAIDGPQDFLPGRGDSAAALNSLAGGASQGNIIGKPADSDSTFSQGLFSHIDIAAVEAKNDAEASNDRVYHGRQSVDPGANDKNIGPTRLTMTLGSEARETAKGNSHNDAPGPWHEMNHGYSAIAKENLGQVILRPNGEHLARDDELKLSPQLQVKVDTESDKSPVVEIVHPAGETHAPDSQQGEQGPFLQYRHGEPLQAPVHASSNQGLQHNASAFQVVGLTDSLPTEPAAEATLRRSVVEQVAGEINGHIRIGKTQAVIQLDPPELGRLKIALHVDGKKLEARIITENHQSRALIESHLHELRQALGENRLELVDVRVDGVGWGGAHTGGREQARQEANGGSQPGSSPARPARDGSDEREPVRRQFSAHESGRVSMWA
jgi:Flagellar hook-length control protein FliK